MKNPMNTLEEMRRLIKEGGTKEKEVYIKKRNENKFD
jgi:hypothetical protein